MLTMLAGIAQFERGMMLERQAEGIAMAKRAGRFNGSFSYQEQDRTDLPDVAAGETEGANCQRV
ncbi:MAG: hypothetical protein RBR06_02095 [Desulfuromonadaceae bacterium]|nr:hypothetical protein [Desulfuromonadaceae bacterium]